MDFSGIHPALTTPFTAEGSVDAAGLQQNISRYNETDITGYVAAGSTGESVMLTRQEWETVLTAVQNAAAPGKLTIAGTGAESTAETIRRTKFAADLGYDVALVKTPFYYKPFYKAENLITHYNAVADASPIPVLLYSMPLFTGLTLEATDILELSGHPNIAGVKDSSGDIRRMGEVIAGARSDFQMFTGAASVVYPALAIGGHGGILALASALPEKCAALFGLFHTGKLEQARELQRKLVVASRKIVSDCGIAGVKYVMDLRGYCGGVPRLPLQPLRQDAKQRILGVLAELEPAAARA